MVSIGSEIKKLRTAKNMTIKTLAEKTGLSVGFISNVERGVNSPTINSLQHICEALDTDIADFFRPSASSSIVSRRADCQHLEMPANYHTVCDLFPLINRKLHPSFITIGPDGFYGDPPLCHEGEEVCLVIAGVIEITAGDDTYTLEQGDCIYIESQVPHSMRNTGEVPCETVWVTLRYHYK